MVLLAALLAALLAPGSAGAEMFACVTKGATTVLKDGSPEAVDAVEGKGVSINLDAKGASLVLINDSNNAVARFACHRDRARPGVVECARPDETLRLNRRTGVMLRTVTTRDVDFVLSLVLICTRPKPAAPLASG
ncbi:hypothetical protein U8607_21095 [Methylobacterium durans]|uniref:hypothetical protein n=1 Tax=Methylobacterium durans TaxID=2202825 RepID=UPI002AFE4737|nr:hypothetical protein [Methylobacterium durans]MEA1834594.1 hypothetical protein [Methylobacterium durans]